MGVDCRRAIVVYRRFEIALRPLGGAGGFLPVPILAICPSHSPWFISACGRQRGRSLRLKWRRKADAVKAREQRQVWTSNDITYIPAVYPERARLNYYPTIPRTKPTPKPAQPMCIRMCRLYPHAGLIPIPKHRGPLLTIPPHSSSGARHDFTRLMLPYGQHKPTPVRCPRHARSR